MSPRRNTSPVPSHRRHAAVAAFAAACTLAACSADRVTAPSSPTPSAAPALDKGPKAALDATKRLSDAALTALALTWRTTAADIEAPTTAPVDLACGFQGVYVVQQRVGRSGGTLKFGRSELRIPSGALASDVQITATITLGRGVRVQFAPHGLQFAKAAELRVDWTGCTIPAGESANLYYTDAQDRVTQVMPSSTTGTRSRMLTDHFSGYAVAWSRTTRTY